MIKEVIKFEYSLNWNFLVLTLVFFSFFGGVIAEEFSKDDLAEAGVIPGSLFYGIDRFIESLSLAFTFDRASKIRARLDIAEERLSEIHELVENGKFEYVDDSRKDYEKMLSEISKLIFEFGGGESSDVLKRAVELELEIKAHLDRASQFSNLIKEDISKADLGENDSSDLNDVVDKIGLKALDIEDTISEKVSKVELRQRVVSGLSDGDVAKIRKSVQGTNSSDNSSGENKSSNKKDELIKLKTKLEVKGNKLISQKSRDIIDSLLLSLEEEKEKIELKLKMKKKDSVISEDNEVKGSLNSEQELFWGQLDDSVYKDIMDAKDGSEIKIKIEHKAKKEDYGSEGIGEEKEESEDEEED